MTSPAPVSREDLLRVRLVVRRARRLLDSPARWTKGALGRDSRGREVLPDGPAVRWCANGALLREGSYIDQVILKLRRSAKPGNIGVDDVGGSATGLLATRVVGAVLEESLARQRGREPLRLSASGYGLTEDFNDARQTHHRDIADLLAAADRRLTRELDRLRKEEQVDGAA
jgi:hypothetical protein